MNLFTKVLNDCLQEPKTTEKIKLLSTYFKKENKKNLPLAFHLLIGENFGRFCSGKLLREWCAECVNLPIWIIDESYEALGDNSETISLCFANKKEKTNWELHKLCGEMLKLKKEPIPIKKEWILSKWNDLSAENIYSFNKLMGGGIRIGASKKNVLKALSEVVTIDVPVLEQRLLNNWEPTNEKFMQLISKDNNQGQGLSPYPFFLASPITSPIAETISTISEWIIEPKWDGIRAQLVHRKEGTALWSRGNDLISEQFPDILNVANLLPYGVYDGEILAWKENKPLPFYELQKRLNRKKIAPKLLKDTPCIMKLYDCIEINGEDIRSNPLKDRRTYINHLTYPFLHSTELNLQNLEALTTYVQAARKNNIEGVIIKRKNSTYQAGRVRGDWWKLKVNPLHLDVVIMYAQKGKGIRSGLYSDYTFGVWEKDSLVPIGKAYSGLTNEEIKQVNQIIKKNLTDKFGPVRGVKPCIMLEVAFDDIHPSPRHKSGIALRFPRIQRLRLDKPITEANTLEDAQKLC
tara:strand:- start:68 stop:1630 length:1563 start_codon:yes stop_codon:yes gene_type:complete